MIRTTIFLILLVFFLGAAINSPFGALLAYLWFAFFRPGDWVWIDITGYHLSFVSGCILVFRSLLSDKFPSINTPVSFGILLFLLSGLIAQYNAINASLGWYWLGFFSRLSLVALLLITLVDSERRFYLTVLTIASCFGFYTFKAGVAALLGGGTRFFDGLAGSFVDNNGYALGGVMILPLLLAVSENIPEEWRFRRVMYWGYRIAIPFSMYFVICTFSRGALLALIAVTSLYAVLKNKKAKLVGILFLLYICLPILPIPKGYESRVSTITNFEETEETSAISRLHFWKVALNMAVDNPLGVGLFHFEPQYNKYDFLNGKYGFNRAVHNSHLQALTENGFIGFTAWILLFVYAIRVCIRIRRSAKDASRYQELIFYENMATALLLSMCGFVVGGTFLSMSLNDLTWITFALVAVLDKLYRLKIQGSEIPSAWAG